jgi:hypothetical protein
MKNPNLTMAAVDSIIVENRLGYPSGLLCPSCGVDAACQCGVAPITRAAYALLKNPEKSNRAIAMEIGVSEPTVRRARTASPDAVDAKRVGLDGKARRQPATTPPAPTPSSVIAGRTDAEIAAEINALHRQIVEEASRPAVAALLAMTAERDALRVQLSAVKAERDDLRQQLAAMAKAVKMVTKVEDAARGKTLQ